MSSHSIEEICSHIGSELPSERNVIIKNITSLKNADSESISFVTKSSFKDDLKASQARFLIVRKEDLYLCEGRGIIHANPYLAYAKLTQLFNPRTPLKPSIDPTAIIEQDVTIGKTAFIGPFNCIGKLSVIEEGVIVMSHVSI